MRTVKHLEQFLCKTDSIQHLGIYNFPTITYASLSKYFPHQPFSIILHRLLHSSTHQDVHNHKNTHHSHEYKVEPSKSLTGLSLSEINGLHPLAPPPSITCKSRCWKLCLTFNLNKSQNTRGTVPESTILLPSLSPFVNISKTFQ